MDLFHRCLFEVMAIYNIFSSRTEYFKVFRIVEVGGARAGTAKFCMGKLWRYFSAIIQEGYTFCVGIHFFSIWGYSFCWGCSRFKFQGTFFIQGVSIWAYTFHLRVHISFGSTHFI